MKNILIVGGTNIDNIIFLDDALPQDGKTNAAYTATMLGGGGANVAIGLSLLNGIFEPSAQTTLCTKIGSNTKTHSVINELINRGIDLVIAAPREETAIPENTVISHKAGRSIVRMSAFNAAALPVPQDMLDKLKKKAASSDLVFLQTKHPDIADIAAKAAHEHGIPVVVDFSNTECPESLLDYADYALLPAELRFDDMAANADGKALLNRVAQRVPYVAVSDSSQPTLICADGKKREIASMPVSTKDSLGAGDLRDAAFCFFLLRDNHPDTALRKANIIASISCEYYGREWEKHLSDRLQHFPEFANDFPYSDYGMPPGMV